MSDLPHYYSSLESFREVFRLGAPVLTYHHVGPRTRGARLKGLYLSAKLFDRQIAELAAAGFAMAGLEDLAAPPPVRRGCLLPSMTVSRMCSTMRCRC